MGAFIRTCSVNLPTTRAAEEDEEMQAVSHNGGGAGSPTDEAPPGLQGAT